MIRFFRQYISVRKTVFIFGEGILIYTVVTTASFLMDGELQLEEFVSINWWRILIVMVAAQLCLFFRDLYELNASENMIDLSTLLIQAIGITSILLALVYFFWQDAKIGKWVFLVSIVFILLFLVLWRILYSYAIHKKVFAERALIVGDGELASDLQREIAKRSDIAYDITGVVVPKFGEAHGMISKGMPLLYGFENLSDFAEANSIKSIIVALDQKRGVMPYKELLCCKVRGIKIIDGETFYERITGKLFVERINPSWLIFSEGFGRSRISRFMKRLGGLTISTIMLALFFPLMALVAVAIKLESKGPVFFDQERVGEFGTIFKIKKFRSMRNDAEKDTGPVWAEEDDPRITRVGRIIRRLRIDELPQLWNVLKGEMSFVGPRPERPFFVEKLKNTIPYYKERFTTKPGVTGWAQIKYPYGASEEDALEKLKYDLYYIKNRSVVMDFMVIFQTVKTVLLSRGSR
jgi:sugar transferase (PEP-CTERM system associated)